MILYIGNKLSSHGFTPTNVETLGMQLAEYYDIVTVSDKKNKLLRMWDIALAVVRYRNEAGKVIVDTYSTSNFYFALVAAILCHWFKIPYIPILHGGNLPVRLDSSKALSDFIFKHSYRNVAPSGYLKYEFEKRGYDNLVLIPNNIDIDNYAFKCRDIFAPRLLWVRSFASLYNPAMAIKALHELKKRYPETTLCMVGQDKDGSMETCRELAKELKVGDSVVFTGRLSKPEWIKLSEEYDIFINTTNFDNTPVSVIEAMALGLPVVSTNVGGVPYIIEDGKNGHLVPADDLTAMTGKIISIIENPTETHSLCSEARSMVESFDWQVVKEQWRGLLK